MSRVGTGDTVVVKPSMNIYTVLTGVATLVALLAFFVVYHQGQLLFGSLF